MLGVLPRFPDHRVRLPIVMQSQSAADLTQLATVTAINSLLQKENQKLQKTLDELRAHPDQADVEELRREFAERLGSYEKQIANLKDKNDALKAQVQTASQGGTASQARLAEKERSLKDLQTEAEALARKNGELESIVRKLRTDMRTVENERDREKQRIRALEAEAATEQARTAAQIEALEQNCAGLESELEAVRLEAEEQVAAVRRAAAEAVSGAQNQLEAGRTSDLASARHREEQLQQELASLHEKYEAAEDSWGQKESAMRREIGRLEGRILTLEDENANLVATASQAAQPLLRQLEALNASLALEEEKHARVQQGLTVRINEAEAAVAAAQHSENQLKTRVTAAEAGLTAAKEKTAGLAIECERLKASLDEERRRSAALVAERDGARQLQASAERRAESTANSSNEQIQAVVEKLYAAEEKIRDLQAAAPAFPQELYAGAGPGSHHPTPPGSIGVPQEGTSAEGAGPAASFVASETDPDDLDSLIRAVEEGGQRQGAVTARTTQLLQQLRVAEQNMVRAKSEANAASARAQALEEEACRARQLQQDLEALRDRFNMALELVGERNELVEQLELDILEMKDIFHKQIGIMADQLMNAGVPQGTASRSAASPSTSAGPLPERMGRN